MADVFSRATVRKGGVQFSSLPGSLKFNPGGVERTPIVNDDGTVDHSTKPVHSEIEFDVSVKGDLDIIALNSAAPETITVEGNNGHAWVCRNCVLAAPVSVQSGDGKATLKFIGAPAAQN